MKLTRAIQPLFVCALVVGFATQMPIPQHAAAAQQASQTPVTPATPASGPAGQPAARGRAAGAPVPPAVIVPSGATTVALWPNGAPGSEARKGEAEEIRGEQILNVHNPSITVLLPRKEVSTGVGLVLAPGGGHTSLYVMHEGYNAAQVLNEKGIAVFVLKNRLQSSGYKFDVEGLADMQRALKVVRSRASEWGVDPTKIGAGGFSAGGELAELVALRHDLGTADAADPVERLSSRPDFQVLIYPGKSELIQPVAGSPPAFMAAGNDDRPDISIGLAEAYLRFKKAGVPAELHMYAKVGHGFGVRPARAGESHAQWTAQLLSFLKQTGMIK
ncbi:MAG: alpha/beta hydrolase [Vicinamibacterales bacterium]